VRVAEASASAILAALDMGASGVLVPHVDTPEQAAAAVSASRYVGGTRGYSGSSRHGGYGTRPMRELIPAADRCVVVCQIESPAAVKNAPAIAQVSGVDAVFIGRGDLAVSMGIQDTRHPAVADLARQAIASALAAGKAVGMYVGSTEERQEYMAQGVTWFVQGSDQSLLRDAANRMAVAA
jgi:2-keto-3-deoxy-L-rhamnonate aldolase RhmA